MLEIGKVEAALRVQPVDPCPGTDADGEGEETDEVEERDVVGLSEARGAHREEGIGNLDFERCREGVVHELFAFGGREEVSNTRVLPDFRFNICLHRLDGSMELSCSCWNATCGSEVSSCGGIFRRV